MSQSGRPDPYHQSYVNNLKASEISERVGIVICGKLNNKNVGIWFLSENMRNSPAHFQSSLQLQNELSKTRAKLTETDALDIYRCKASVTSAAAISKLYGVSEKAVRDIWTGRTWSKETWHLDESRPIPTKKMGRPLGRKDGQPRKSRGLQTIPESQTSCDKHVHFSPESQSIDIAPVFSLVMNEWPRARKMDNDVMPSSAWCCRNQSIDELLHEKTQCGFDTTFEDPFGTDWAAVHRRLQQSMWQ